MVKKHVSNKYVTLEDVRVSYNYKDDSIHITSGDPDVQSSGFHLSLNKDTQTERVLRNILVENEIISSNPAVSVPVLDSGSKIISIVSPKGGAGKTSFTYSLASLLAKDGIKVAVVDSDFRDGQLSAFIGEVCPTIIGFIADAKNNPSIDNYMVPSGKGWDALLAPVRPVTAEFVTPEILDEIFTQLKESYDVVLVDSSVRPDAAANQHLYKISDYVFCLVNNNISTLSSFVRWSEQIKEFMSPDVFFKKTGLVFNSLFNEDNLEAWDNFPIVRAVGSMPYSKEFHLALHSVESFDKFINTPSAYVRHVKRLAKLVKSLI